MKVTKKELIEALAKYGDDDDITVIRRWNNYNVIKTLRNEAEEYEMRRLYAIKSHNEAIDKYREYIAEAEAQIAEADKKLAKRSTYKWSLIKHRAESQIARWQKEIDDRVCLIDRYTPMTWKEYRDDSK